MRHAVTMLTAAMVCASSASPAFASPPLPAVTRAAVEAALEGDTIAGSHQPFAPREPSRLRPCCAFGHDLRVKLLGVPLPLFRLESVRGPEDVGPHEYNPGLLQLTPGPAAVRARRALRGERRRPAREHNGIAYTCRGGFVDTAHVRDFADLAWFLMGQVDRRLDTGGTIELEALGGERRVTIRPVAPEVVERAGRLELVAAIAQWLSFELSVWREIATWYGYQSVPPWSEKLSSFSPEDLYSNLLGTKLAGGIVRTTAIRDELDYDRAMSAWLPAALEALGIVSQPSAAAAMHVVDGAWWDSARRIPDWRVTKRRRIDMGPAIEPWLAGPPQAPHANIAGCSADERPAVLRHQDAVAGVAIPAVATIEVLASSHLVAKGLPLPRGTRLLGVDDFPAIAAQVRREAESGAAATSVARADPLR